MLCWRRRHNRVRHNRARPPSPSPQQQSLLTMPPRPAGTDGTDYSYREVIVERYKRMAEYKDAIIKLIGLHFTFVLLKLAWSYAVLLASDGRIELPKPVLGLLAGELLLVVVFRATGLGGSKESLRLLKAFNLLQALLTATAVLSAWIYHWGVQTGGVPTWHNAHAVAAYLAATHPQQTPGAVLDYAKALELFLDATTAAFLALGTFVSHKMIVDKMAMKGDKARAGQARAGAIRGGGDSDSDSDSDDGAAPPQAVPLTAEAEPRPKVAKAAAGGARRRHA